MINLGKIMISLGNGKYRSLELIEQWESSIKENKQLKEKLEEIEEWFNYSKTHFVEDEYIDRLGEILGDKT